MKNIVFALSALLSATAFAAYPTGDYMTWFGSYAGKDVTNSSGSSFFGAWAGEGGEYINYSTYLGALSGYRSYNVNRSVGLGPWALREARNVYGTVAIGTSAGRGIEGCTNCVFIGANAGRGVMVKNNCIDICGVFKYAGGVGQVDCEKIYFGDCSFSDIISHFASIEKEEIMNSKVFHGIADSAWSIDYRPGTFLNFNTIEGHESLYATINHERHEVAFKDDLDNYVRKDATALHITDEDTGDKYIVKVKSGALKLYKVDETEE